LLPIQIVAWYTYGMIIIGHRGARGLAPENSLASFDKAIELHADFVEFDVRVTRDQNLVIIHDRHTKRIAFIKQHIHKMTLAEVKALATRDGIAIPTLEEVLLHIRGRTKLNIEIKSIGTAQLLLDALEPFFKKKKYALDDIIISSSRLSELRAVQHENSRLRVALLQRRFPWRFLFVTSVGLYGIGTRHTLLTPQIIRKAKSLGLFTYAYTVNKPAQARKLRTWGLDGICTDRPDLIQP